MGRGGGGDGIDEGSNIAWVSAGYPPADRGHKLSSLLGSSPSANYPAGCCMRHAFNLFPRRCRLRGRRDVPPPAACVLYVGTRARPICQATGHSLGWSTIVTLYQGSRSRGGMLGLVTGLSVPSSRRELCPGSTAAFIS